MPSQSAYLGESIDQLRAANDQLKTRIRELEAELEATQYTAAASDVPLSPPPQSVRQDR